MILVRSPLRITLGGGGTDLPAYAEQYGGFCLTAAITQYVYVSVIRPFEPGIYLKYSQLEHVGRAEQVQHPILRETLRTLEIKPQIEITTLADVPAGTGLGSSSSFTTALIAALSAYAGMHLSTTELAAAACQIEIDRLGAPIGPQDQYAAAYGGLLGLKIPRAGLPCAQRLALSREQLQALEDRLLLYFTGYTRQTNTMLSGHSIDGLHEIRHLGRQAKASIEAADWRGLGELFDAHWALKRRRSPLMSRPEVDLGYQLGKHHGAIGGKLVGAGGGGCLLFLTEDPQRLRAGLKDSGLQEIRFRFDLEGTKVLTT